MTLLLREADVEALLPMSEAVHLVREALSTQSSMGGTNLPRRRLDLERGVLNVMAASVPCPRADGLKAYTVARGGARFLVALWDRHDGTLLALIEADNLGRIRTGAASGVATDALANPAAEVLAVIGSGNQARTQVNAVASVRKLRRIRVFSRSAEHRVAFASDLAETLSIDARACDSAQEAVSGAEIIVTITSSAEPVIEGHWLTSGCHLNVVGSNWAARREVDTETVARSNLVCVDSTEQAHLEAGDLLIPVHEGRLSWESVVELGDILAGQAPGRANHDDITLFKSLGIAVEDVAVARHVYNCAVSQGVGEQTNFGDVGE